ncbi:hypothetical protein [Paenibacillus amylolyticus]|uniref:hypothetical protein n=1 Tax=Paenibacillus amylolyticus TaxID=1451 RepID=UPI00201E745B|nr:hypothetical protein [Paenibacillus amylolyticus]MCL6663425.1 hypothetical protein [Paenibacillus amylolyticus]
MTIMIMSSKSRVKNSYESLYYCADSKDPETDDIVREQIQKSFADYDVLLSDRPSHEKLLEIMLDAYKASMKQLAGLEPTELETKTFIRDFDRFTKDHEHFYDVTYEMYEVKYQGDTVDLSAEFERSVRDKGGIYSLVVEETNNSVKTDSKISYLGHVPQAYMPVTSQTYDQASFELIRGDVDDSKLHSNKQYTVNDQELDNNGPEL